MGLVILVSGFALLALAAASPRRASAAFPGRNGVIAFTFFRPRSAHIFSVSADGTNLRQLTRGHDERSPSFSPNGKQIAFVRDGFISVMNSDGSNVHQVKVRGACPGSSSVCFYFSPRFSADGTRIVFEGQRASKNQRGILSGTEHAGIFIMNADGSHLHQLTSHTLPFCGVGCTVDADAVFSPDGRSIAFDRYLKARKATEIFVMNADRSNVHQLTHTPTGYSAQPDFSPDGSQIAFTQTFNGQLHVCKPNGECITKRGRQDGICVMNADGSNQRQLTNLSLLNSTPDSTPAFSPDGQSVVFVRDAKNLFVINVDGSNLRRLTNVGASNNAGPPTWQPVH